jgi:hypothetical protein
MSWTGHEARMGEERKSRIFDEKSEKEDSTWNT